MFTYTDLNSYADFLRNNSDGCLQAVEHYLGRIRENLSLNAYVEVYDDEARERAKALDNKRLSGENTGKLHGVIIAIKDVICFEGHKVSAGSKMLDNFSSLYNSTVVKKMLEEDAIIIGNCNCDEFAMGSTNENSAYGAVLNALDHTRVSGGSSGGSAVAVQAGLCMVSLGSDTGGSVRQPADFCGIVGMKPTYGRVSRYGLIAYASSFDQVGIFGSSVSDVAALLEVIAGKDEFDSTVSQEIVPAYTEKLQAAKDLRLAYFPEAIEHEGLDDEIRFSVKELISELGRDHLVDAVTFEWLDYLVPTYYVLTTAEASSNLSRYDGVRFGHRTKTDVADLQAFYKKSRSEGFGLEVKRRIMLGNYVLSEGYFDAYFTKAQQVRRLISEKVKAIFEKYDVILIPTVPSTAFKLGSMQKDPVAMYLADIYTVFANLAGIPAISIPLWKHSNGMPFGLQIMSNKMDEVTLLQAANLLQEKFKQREQDI